MVERTLFLNGTIAEDSWFDDDVTPQMFKEELLDGSGNITVWINSPGGDLYLINGNMTKLKDAGIFAGKEKKNEEVLELEEQNGSEPGNKSGADRKGIVPKRNNC